MTTSKPRKDSHPEVRIELVEVTPELAEEWLGRNTHNRGVKDRKVHELAGAIKRGEWTLNGEAIKWSWDDPPVLLDGQHRLLSVIASATPIKTYVAWNVDPAAQETMDLGARRSLGDALKLRGEVNQTSTAACINLLHRWTENTEGEFRSRSSPTVRQAIDYFYEHAEGIREAVRVGHNLVSSFPVTLPVSVVATCYYVFSSIDDDDAEFFFDRLRFGTELAKDSPIYALRRTLINSRMEYDSVKIHALMIKAWNMFRDGQTASFIVWKQGGANPERFPIPK